LIAEIAAARQITPRAAAGLESFMNDSFVENGTVCMSSETNQR